MDKKVILNKILGKTNNDGDASGLVVSTPYTQLNTKNNLISSYPSLAGATKNDIYGSKIEDLSSAQQSSQYKPTAVGPQLNGGTVGAIAMGGNSTGTYGKQPAEVLMHEQLHNQFDKKNKGQEIKDSSDVYQNTTDKLNIPSKKFDDAYDKYLSKNFNKSDKTIERMKYIEDTLSKYYTDQEKSTKMEGGYDRANERFAYLGMNPDLIPRELKKYYKGVLKQ